jgi:hypothetical protein
LLIEARDALSLLGQLAEAVGHYDVAARLAEHTLRWQPGCGAHRRGRHRGRCGGNQTRSESSYAPRLGLAGNVSGRVRKSALAISVPGRDRTAGGNDRGLTACAAQNAGDFSAAVNSSAGPSIWRYSGADLQDRLLTYQNAKPYRITGRIGHANQL